ncbi:hypothetical protein GCM10023170_099170 [Phytohabitans houttuyneae]|uniref:Uncharacterized protein n=1 Tax=Phytohabitans houttuyneae TaxID=1076126 RepID=A0A6V8KEJ5_9ACTN|nr:hypothetical protein Phou_078230 [Phytohabitans houttuyneae]
MRADVHNAGRVVYRKSPMTDTTAPTTPATTPTTFQAGELKIGSCGLSGAVRGGVNSWAGVRGTDPFHLFRLARPASTLSRMISSESASSAVKEDAATSKE